MSAPEVETRLDFLLGRTGPRTRYVATRRRRS